VKKPAGLRSVFVTGLLVTLPAVVTAYVLWAAFNYLDGILQPALTRGLGFRIPGVGFVALVLLILLIGGFASNFLGERIVRAVTSRLDRIPLWSPVYRAVRDISTVLLKDRSTSFRQVALMQWPRKGVYAMVFVTSEEGTPSDAAVGRQMISVLLPTTPNPTSGFYMMVPRSELIYLDLSVEQALKVIISGGAAYVPPVALAPEEDQRQAAVDVDAAPR
jgi:uncharacterized membrane protein